MKEGEKSTTELINFTNLKFQEELDITLEDYDINKIYCIGKTTNKEKPRPTLLTFINGSKKVIFKNKKKIEDVNITEDYFKYNIIIIIILILILILPT